MTPDRKSLWGLGWTHFFLSASTLMVTSVLPIFMREQLGASAKHIGWMEGVAVGLAFLAKIFSGVLSDIFRKRKPFIVWGSFLSFCSKPFFILAALMLSTPAIVCARFFDRLSKGIRTAPADALTADLSPTQLRGNGFGLRQALYVSGCAAGMLATAFLLAIKSSYALIFGLAAVPSLLALLTLFFFTQEAQTRSESKTWKLSDFKRLPSAFWKLLFVAFLLMFGRFSEFFVLLKARHVGCPLPLLPLFFLPEFIVQALIAYPTGKFADRIDTKHLLAIGILILSVASSILALASSPWHMLFGSLILGLHLGVTQVVLKKSITDTTPSQLHGTAFAFFYLTEGTALFLCNPLAGMLADHFSLHAPFWQACTASLLSAMAVMLMIRKGKG